MQGLEEGGGELLRRHRHHSGPGVGLADASADALEQMPARVAQLVRNQPDARFERCHCLELQGNALIVELVYGLEGVDLERHRLVQQRVTLGLNRLLQELSLPLASN